MKTTVIYDGENGNVLATIGEYDAARGDTGRRRRSVRISKTLCKAIAEQIIAGRMFFAEVTKRLRSGVASALKALGREDLATDSNARPKDKEEKE